MSIIRVQKHDRYVVMEKTGLEDPRLSFKAKGLLAYLLAKPNEWQVKVKALAKVGPDGERAVYAALRELLEAGYAERTQTREGGKIKSWDYVVRERPDVPHVENLHVEKLHVENATLLSKESTEEGGPSDRASDLRSSLLSEDQMDLLPESHGKPSASEVEAEKVRTVFERWKELRGTAVKLTSGRRNKIRARLKTYTVEQLVRALENAAGDKWLRGDNERGTDYFRPETVFKNDEAVEHWLEPKPNNRRPRNGGPREWTYDNPTEGEVQWPR